MKPYTAANLPPADGTSVHRDNMGVPELNRLLDIREGEIGKLELALHSARGFIADELATRERSYLPNPSQADLDDLESARLAIVKIDAALASQPAPEPVKLPEGPATAYLDKPYTFILQRDEEGDWVITVHEFPGCTAHGRTPTEAFAVIREIMWHWVDMGLENGQEIPPPGEAIPWARKKPPKGIALPLTVRELGAGAYMVVDSNGDEVAPTDTREQADWICAALNAAGGDAK